MIDAVWKLNLFINMLYRISETSRNERVTHILQVVDVCTLGHTAHIQAVV
jgi:hypothetical protein